MFQTLKQQCGRLRSEERLAAGDKVCPGLYLLQHLPSLFVWGHTLSDMLIFPVFMTQRPHGQESPCCGRSVHNCHQLMMTPGDTFHPLHWDTRQLKPVCCVQMCINMHHRDIKYHFTILIIFFNKTGTRSLCCHSSHDC